MDQSYQNNNITHNELNKDGVVPIHQVFFYPGIQAEKLGSKWFA